MKDMNESDGIRGDRLRKLVDKFQNEVNGLKPKQLLDVYLLCTVNDEIADNLTDEKFLEIVGRIKGNFYNEDDLF